MERGKRVFFSSPAVLDVSLFDEHNQSLSEIPLMGNVHELEQLNASSNGLTDVPVELFTLAPRLRNLYLQNNEIAHLTPLDEPCESLRTLILSDNPYSDASSLLSSFPLLRTVFVSRTLLRQLPCTDRKVFDSLQWIDVSCSSVEEIPDCIGAFVNLQGLHAQENRISRVSAEIGRCAALTALNLSCNEISSLPSSLEKCTQLHMLLVAQNQLSELPEGVCALKSLEFLDCSQNMIECLPDSIAQATSLRYLFAHDNSLLQLPPLLGALENLDTLTISRNSISSLPFTIGRLQNLRTLRAGGNALSSLPLSFAALAQLTDLDLRGNPLSTPNPRIAMGDITVLRQYLASLVSESAPMARLRLSVVGATRSGKSELLRVLRGESRSLMQSARIAMWGAGSYQPTTGLRMAEWHCDGRQPVTFHTCEFGGDSALSDMAHYFFSSHAIFLVVFALTTDPMDAVDSVMDHLHAIQSSAPGARVLIVGTHMDAVSGADLRRFSSFLRKSLQEWSASLSDAVHLVQILSASKEYVFWPVSCSAGTNVDALRLSLSRNASRHPLILYPPPRFYAKVWEAIRAYFDGRFPPFVSWDTLKAAACDLVSESQLVTALVHLHHCGLLLFPHPRTQRAPREGPISSAAYAIPPLRDIAARQPETAATAWHGVIIHQQWLANAILATKTAKGVAGGAVPSKLLQTAFEAAGGAAAVVSAEDTLQIVLALQVIVPFSGYTPGSLKDAVFLVPSLLPALHSNVPRASDVACDMRMWVTLPVHPPGLISRLMCVFMLNAEVQSCWRDGVVVRLRHGEIAIERVIAADGTWRISLAVTSLRYAPTGGGRARAGSMMLPPLPSTPQQPVTRPRVDSMASLPIPIAGPRSMPRMPVPLPPPSLPQQQQQPSQASSLSQGGVSAPRPPVPESPWSRAIASTGRPPVQPEQQQRPQQQEELDRTVPVHVASSLTGSETAVGSLGLSAVASVAVGSAQMPDEEEARAGPAPMIVAEPLSRDQQQQLPPQPQPETQAPVDPFSEASQSLPSSTALPHSSSVLSLAMSEDGGYVNAFERRTNAAIVAAPAPPGASSFTSSTVGVDLGEAVPLPVAGADVAAAELAAAGVGHVGGQTIILPPELPQRAVVLMARTVRRLRSVLEDWFGGASAAAVFAVPCSGCVTAGVAEPCMFIVESAMLVTLGEDPATHWLQCLRDPSHPPTHVSAICTELLAAQWGH